METSIIDPKTGMFLWSAKAMTVAVILFMIWLKNKDKSYLILFFTGLVASSIGFALVLLHGRILSCLSEEVGTSATLIALSFWMAGILSFQKRKLEVWIVAPIMIWWIGILFPQIDNFEIHRVVLYNIASITGYALLALSIVRINDHVSTSRKVLASMLFAYGLLNALGFYLQYDNSMQVQLPSPVNGIMTTIMSLGFISVLVVAAKMMIEDNERHLKRLASTDYLTGALNRRGLTDAYEELKAKPEKVNEHLVFTTFDIDHFKRINDRYGHQVGDAVLANFSALVRQHTDNDVILTRMGGEEFALISRTNELRRATAIAEKIRMEFAANPLEVNQQVIQTTVSVGIAAQPVAKATLEHLMSMSDRALYSAKRTGRNRTVVHDDDVNVTIPAKDRVHEEDDVNTDKQVTLLNRITHIARNNEIIDSSNH